MRKKLLSLILAISMVVSMLVVPVSAAETLPSVTRFSYGENKDDMKAFAQTYTYSEELLGQQIEGTNWRFRNAAESPDGIGNASDTVPLKFGVNSSGYQFITARSTSTLNGNADKYNTNEAKTIPALVLTKDLTGLTSNQHITVQIMKYHGTVTPGIRFMVHNGGKNYYAVLIAGNQWSHTKGLELVKSVNGEVTSLAKFDYADNSFQNIASQFIFLDIKTNNGTISVAASGADKIVEGSYTDSQPFNVRDNDCGVWLMAFNGGNNKDRDAQFRNFSITSNEMFIDYVPETIMFTDAAAGKVADADGILDLGKATPIRKIYYTGAIADEEILVSNDKTTWYYATNLNGFKDGVWTNQTTDQGFRYIKAGAYINDLKILTEISEITATLAGTPIKLYPRINSVDAFENATLSADASILSVNGLEITPVGVGETTVTATYDSKTLSIPVKVENVQTYSYVDDLSGASAQELSGLGTKIEGTNWRMRNAAETPNGLAIHNDNTAVQFGIRDGALYLEGPFDGAQSHNEACAATVPSLVLDTDLSQITKDHKITYEADRNHFIVSTGVRFMVHNNGLNYYALVFGGQGYRGDIGNRGWELLKFTNGKMEILMQGGTNKYPAFSELTNKSGTPWKYEITVADNTISFKVTQTDKSENTFGASYTDNNMFDVSGNNCGVWLMAATANNNSSRYATFKNFKIENLVPYISGYEPSKVVYLNAAEGKTADANGVIDLGSNYVVRKVTATGSGTVYISKDNKAWISLGNLADGFVLNKITDSAVRYVKVVGTATGVKALAQIRNNRLEIGLNEQIKVYPYINGSNSGISLRTESNNIEINGNTIKGVNVGKGIVVSAANSLNETVDFIVDVVGMEDTKFECQTNAEFASKWDFYVSAMSLKGTTNTIIVAFYDNEGALIRATAFENVTFNAEGNVSFTADKLALEAGDYGVGYIWNNLTNITPVTSVSDINIID